MGNFAENLNLGNRFRPPPGLAVVYLAALYVDTVFHDLDKNHLRFCALTFLFKNLTFLGKKQYNT